MQRMDIKKSNEYLVRRIQAGECNLIDTLIAQNNGLIHVEAMRYLPAARRNCALDMEDLTQSAVMGMMEAIPAWNESRGAFTTLAVLYMKKSIRAALGIRTTKQRIENMSRASLDAPIDEAENITLGDTLIDDTAIDPAEAAVLADMRRTVRAAVAKLPNDQRREVETVYFMGGKQTNRNVMDKARRTLRHNLRRLWTEYEAAPYHHRGFQAWKYTHTSATEAAVLRRDELMQKVTMLLQTS